MNSNMNNKPMSIPFDPAKPVAGDDDIPAGVDIDALPLGDDPIDALLESATRPPDGLSLDHNQLRAAIAGQAPRGRKPHRPAPLVRVGWAAAMAAIVVLGFLAVLKFQGPPKPINEAVITPPPPATSGDEVVVDDMEDAWKVVEADSATSSDFHMVIPRQTIARLPESPASSAFNEPMMISDTGHSFGTPHIDHNTPNPSDFMVTGFME